MKLLAIPDNEILNIIMPMVESLESGWNENDYGKFSLDLTDDMKEAVNLEEFSKQRDENYPKLGDHVIAELVTLHKNPDNLIAIWKMSFEKRDEQGLCIYHFRENNDKKTVISCAMFHA